MAENKVRFGLKNVHYAIATVGSGGAITYGTPVAVPGAVNFDLSADGEENKFYADNTAYYVTYGNQGYSGSLEIARIPDAMLKDVWGYTEGTTSKVLTENTAAEAKMFALLFEISGDGDNEMYVFYNCTASRPSVASATTDENRTPVTQTVDISASPNAAGHAFARTTASTPTATKTGWYTSVFVEGT